MEKAGYCRALAFTMLSMALFGLGTRNGEGYGRPEVAAAAAASWLEDFNEP